MPVRARRLAVCELTGSEIQARTVCDKIRNVLTRKMSRNVNELKELQVTISSLIQRLRELKVRLS